MANTNIFLIGGGWTAEAYPRSYGPFVQAAAASGRTHIACVVLDTPDRDDRFGMVQFAFNAAGTTDVYPIFVSPERPLQRDDVEDATGIFVAGGHTPSYYDAIVPSASAWMHELVGSGIPYAGNSAGAMIAPDRSIVGGWKMTYAGKQLEICSEDVSEEVDDLDIRPGLGLVSFSVDPHAAQFGTPTRLLHAINAGHVDAGWAIDDDTVLILRDGHVSVAGFGVAWHVRKAEGGLSVAIRPGQS